MDYLARLADRALQRVATAQPRVDPLFAPRRAAPPLPVIAEIEEVREPDATRPAEVLSKELPAEETAPPARPALTATSRESSERSIATAREHPARTTHVKSAAELASTEGPSVSPPNPPMMPALNAVPSVEKPSLASPRNEPAEDSIHASPPNVVPASQRELPNRIEVPAQPSPANLQEPLSAVPVNMERAPVQETARDASPRNEASNDPRRDEESARRAEIERLLGLSGLLQSSKQSRRNVSETTNSRSDTVSRARKERESPPAVEPGRPPVIEVHIGRIEVRATLSMPKSAPARREPHAPKLSLSEYLTGPKGGSR